VLGECMAFLRENPCSMHSSMGKVWNLRGLDPVGMRRAPSLSETSNSVSAAGDGGLLYIADLLVLYDLIFCNS
jgi:hypothetical protein